MHKISRSPSYLEILSLDNDGKLISQSYATGFFIRTADTILLITNWHVVTGLDPAHPNDRPKGKGPPFFIKTTVVNKNNMLTELTIPLYDSNFEPLWIEHELGFAIDLAICRLPIACERYFHFTDIHSIEDRLIIDEKVANDIFIVGYPFSRNEFAQSFGEKAPYYLPIWKRGTIAFEPKLLLDGRLILIDALSRPGMSGSPVFLAQEDKVIYMNAASAAAFGSWKAGAIEAISGVDTSSFNSGRERRFRFVGVYSGTFGATKLAEVALGKCWHVNTIVEAILNGKQGNMPTHGPMSNAHYTEILKELSGRIIFRNRDGVVTDEIPLV